MKIHEKLLEGLQRFWAKRSPWARVLLVVCGLLCLLLGTITPVLSYSIAKRNRLLRQQQHLIAGLQSKLKLKDLEVQRLKIQSDAQQLRRKDGELVDQAAKLQAEKRRKLEELRRRIAEEKTKNKKALERVDRMNAAQQAKEISKILNNWEL